MDPGRSDEKVVPISVFEEFALTVAPGSLPPIGQHSPSITFDQGIMVFDNGQKSQFQDPPGAQRDYASPRKYSLDLVGKVATEVWNFPMNRVSTARSAEAVYEDAPYNYLVDYAFVNGGVPAFPHSRNSSAWTLPANKIFYYQYPTVGL